LKCYIITVDRNVIVKEVDARQLYFFFNNGAYKIDGNHVRLSRKRDSEYEEAEIIFVENNPFPVQYRKNVNNANNAENSDSYDSIAETLDIAVLRNALENITSLKSEFNLVSKLKSFISWFGEPKNITAILILFFIVLLVANFITGGLSIG